jgi:dolichol-phosphate mannosyltransferase
MVAAPPKVVVVVPTYDERENLPKLVSELFGLGLPNLHLLVVDDNSPDGTGEVADGLAAASPERIGVLHRAQKNGLGRAYIEGLTRALSEGADVVIHMDADLSHPVSVIPTMLDLLRSTDVDIVIGSRYVRGGSTAADWSLHRKALSVGANLYVNAILRLHVKDATAGFRAYRARSLAAMDLLSTHSSGYSFHVEMTHRAARSGLNVVEVPIRYVERVSGASKMSVRVQIESALTPWRLLLRRDER